MDPEQTLIEYFDALDQDDESTARSRLADLAEWANKGGWLPGLVNTKLRHYLRRWLAEGNYAEAANTAVSDDPRPGREDSHAPLCASRVGGECTCGKADREMEEDDAEAPDA
jgi:hypothetical protein